MSKSRRDQLEKAITLIIDLKTMHLVYLAMNWKTTGLLAMGLSRSYIY